ncbi:DNA topoisomerase IB [Acidimicrobiaceae bacterium USS-CC1]|uniref:DNA topoisomerase n=1 Tax=Acidiferrimicrobium australe TaxID=2664430 RepID=A0ABW9QWF4_9ACTN|nr:DNA topoisomerase IB [Acidiferrimicrobium australe]
MPRLRRSDPTAPGIRRRRAGRGFVYLHPDGTRVTDQATLARIRGLVLPPAWEDVWIAPWPNGHIQALGTDARGRRQYRYHDAWRAHRDREKFEHVVRFARRLPDVRRRCAEDLASPGMSRDKALGCAVRLLDLGFFRVGGDEYAEDNGSIGLTTLRREHTHLEGDEVIFDYPAKSGRHRVQSVVDPDVRTVIDELRRRRGGTRLLAYREGRRWHELHADDVNRYLRDLAGVPASAKDFRTWHATVLAAVGLAVSREAAHTPTAQRRAVRRAVCEVADYLGNTPAVCRRSYIDPRLVDAYLDGRTVAHALPRLGREGLPATRGAIEAAVIRLLAG